MTRGHYGNNISDIEEGYSYKKILLINTTLICAFKSVFNTLNISKHR